MINPIQNYDEINISENTLIMMDIDDTIIKFETLHKNWWKENEPNALEKWLKIINEEKPTMLDSEKFTELLERIKTSNSEIIFITARYESLSELTYTHLIECGLSINKNQIYHSYPKGKKLLDICEEMKKTRDIQNYIFVDDHLDNIEDVQKYLSQYEVKYYMMNHINIH